MTASGQRASQDPPAGAIDTVTWRLDVLDFDAEYLGSIDTDLPYAVCDPAAIADALDKAIKETKLFDVAKQTD